MNIIDSISCPVCNSKIKRNEARHGREYTCIDNSNHIYYVDLIVQYDSELKITEVEKLIEIVQFNYNSIRYRIIKKYGTILSPYTTEIVVMPENTVGYHDIKYTSVNSDNSELITFNNFDIVKLAKKINTILTFG